LSSPSILRAAPHQVEPTELDASEQPELIDRRRYGLAFEQHGGWYEAK
jgi:hypothetical protein